jgi:CubicO group peptidase (beta-lactamase class C family)
MHSAGGVIMSANDAVRWLELVCEDGVVAGRRAVPAAAVQATRARLAAVSFESDPYQRDAYGLGWTHGAHRGETMLMHFGAFPGFRAHVSYIPARRTGVAVFVNELFVSPLITDAVANYIYDRTAGRSDAPAALESKLAEIVRRRDEFFASVPVNRAERATRAWRLTRPKGAYAGAYENENFGRIDIAAEGERLTAAFGVLHSTAEPFKNPDSIRVEFSPYSGESITFEGEGPAPRALRYSDQTYMRA